MHYLICKQFCLGLEYRINIREMLYTQHNKDDDTIIDEWHSLLVKYTSHFIWKGCVWEGVRDRTELQHIDPHSIGHNCIPFSFSWAAQLGAWGPTLLDAGFLYCILSPMGLVSKLNWLPVFTELYNSSTPSFSCWRHNCTHSTHPLSSL